MYPQSMLPTPLSYSATIMLAWSPRQASTCIRLVLYLSILVTLLREVASRKHARCPFGLLHQNLYEIK